MNRSLCTELKRCRYSPRSVRKGRLRSSSLTPPSVSLVNPARDEFADLKVGSHYFRVGDKVMQTKNNAKASNGDIGYIRKMGRNAKNEMDVTIEFSGDRIAEYGMEEMSHMELAYATTVHKAMGSEFDIVIMPILRSHYIMLNRNIVYTAITRAKEQVIPVGQKKTLIMAILKRPPENEIRSLASVSANI